MHCILQNSTWIQINPCVNKDISDKTALLIKKQSYKIFQALSIFVHNALVQAQCTYAHVYFLGFTLYVYSSGFNR